MNTCQPCRVAQKLLRFRISQTAIATDSISAASSRRFFSAPAARRAAAGPAKGPHSTARVSAVRHSARPSSQLAALAAGIGLLSFAYSISSAPHTQLDSHYAASHSVSASDFEPNRNPTAAPVYAADNRPPGLPRFRISEIRKHGADSENPWVIHGDKVYDITEWISAHPGGQVILRAAGGSIEPYWNIFTIHKSDYVYDILQQYFIGYVDQADLVDGKPAQDEIEDPFANDPERDPSLITMTAKPRNAETPGEALAAQFLTPNELFYVRNHMWVPTTGESTPESHTLTVELTDGTVKEYTLEDLKTKFPQRKVTAVLQCSGNRRKHMSDGSGRATNGLQWNSGAISNASWEGVSLADVLADAGFDSAEAMKGISEAKHVQFAGLEAYGASIPIKKAIDPQGDVLLAHSMNDKPLPRDHGYPLRAIVPGHVAARSVKWLNQIILSDEESTSQWQRKDYKCFGPNQTKVDWDDAPAIQELPVQSAITSMKLGKWVNPKDCAQTIENDPSSAPSAADAPEKQISLSGYAISGGGRAIIRVDISLDGGSSWKQAYLLPDCVAKDGSPSPCQGSAAWAWKRWTYNGTVPMNAFNQQQGKDTKGGGSGERCTSVLVKATDDAYNTQPESHAATWNFRGNLATAWDRLQVCTDCTKAASDAKRK